jgi:dinuclear metal center YbgI/SA1388 family protein
MQLTALLRWLEAFAPPRLAESWDNVGLLLGDPEQTLHKVMTCLTVTPATVAEAVRENVNLIVAHHPIFHKPVQNLSAATSAGRLLGPLLKAGIAVYSPHTAFDNCSGGINDLLAEWLKLTKVRPLQPRAAKPRYKLVVFVPESDLQKVSAALFAAGAGRIGNYEQCSYRVMGTGTFFGGEQTNPAIGQKGRREEAAEWRLEVILPADRLSAVVQALRTAHSYEEPAFDVYPLVSPSPLGGDGWGEGAGRIGELSETLSLKEFARRLGETRRFPSLQTIGPLTKSIQRVAIVCGAGGSLMQTAKEAGADLLLTGELRYHDQLAAEALDLAVVLAGHYSTERPGIEQLAGRIEKAFPSLIVWPSRQERDPAAGV